MPVRAFHVIGMKVFECESKYTLCQRNVPAVVLAVDAKVEPADPEPNPIPIPRPVLL